MVVDRVEDDHSFSSEVGLELLKLKDSNSDSLNPIHFKDVLTTTEDLRIAKQLSTLSSSTSKDNTQIEERRILNRRFNLAEGEQCVRDLFLCLEVKGALHSKLVKQNWPPSHHFSSDMAHLLICWEQAYFEDSTSFCMHFDIFE